jgi:hypothetical protein
VIALAQDEGCTVAKGEQFNDSVDRSNIPDACRAIGVPDINLLQMISIEGWTFG